MKSGVLRVRYYFGYRGRVLREMAAGLLGGGGILVAALLLSLLPVLNFIDIWQRQGDYPALGTWVAGITGVALFALFSCIAVTSLIDLIMGRNIGIAPYFEEPVGANTSAGGREVARSCARLDDLAIEVGATPVSAFGFNDDLSGDVLAWHLPREGLYTVRALIVAIEPAKTDRDRRLSQELQQIEDALLKAHARETRFCFLITHDYTNQLEHEHRQGSFF